MLRKMVTNAVEPILATRPPGGGPGLLTVEVASPLWVHVHLLTHKRLARNRSSARYMSAARYAAVYHTPPFYDSNGALLTGPRRVLAWLIWHGTNQITGIAARKLARLGVHREVANRLTTQAVVGTTIATATEPAWRAFLALRNTPEADRATREVASSIQYYLDSAQWRFHRWHIPYAPEGAFLDSEYLYTAMARVARVSTGRPRPGQRSDLVLARQLISNGHLSPSEHIACWGPEVTPSALCSKPEDTQDGHCWQPLRLSLEGEGK